MSDVSPAPSQLQTGTTFAGRYDVVRCISMGGMGAIYEVVHRDTKRRRALKVMLPSLLLDRDMRERFALEAVVTADVESEHIVETFDAGIDETTGCPFLVMELLKGQDLSRCLRERGPLGEREVIALLEQAARGLDKTHARGIVHRDLKPENLFLTSRDDGTPRLKILDFGIAKIVAQSQALSGTRNLGSPLYMAPEQLDGGLKIGPATDLYALAQIAFTLLVGRPYWEDDAVIAGGVYALLMKVARGIPEPASARAAAEAERLPSGFDAWFAKATALSPDDRFRRASEQVEALRELLPSTTGPEAPLAVGLAGTTPAATAQAETSPGSPGVGHTTGFRPMVMGSDARARSTRWPVVAAVLAVGAGALAIVLRFAAPDASPPSPKPESATAEPTPPAADPPAAARPGPADTAAPVVSAAGTAPPVESSSAASPHAGAPKGGRPPATAKPTAAASAPPASSEPWRLR